MGHYDTTVGTLLMGVLLNTFLYGIVTYQFAMYYRTRFNDRPLTKYTVLFLFILDTFHSLSAIYMLWFYVVENYADPVGLTESVWPYPYTAIGTALSASVTQTYQGFRIWCLTDSKILYSVTILLTTLSLILATITSVEGWVIHAISQLPLITPFAIAWLSMQVVADTFVTTTLVIVYSRSRTGMRRMDTVLNSLIRGAIQTGLFAGIFSIADLVTFVLFPTTSLYSMFNIPIGRIYTNTLMSTLLTRVSIRTEMNGMDHFGSLGWAPPDTSQGTPMVHATSFQPMGQKMTQGVSICEGEVVTPPEV